ncbi:MAG: hypothetical protein OEN23_17590 [Paracoccaceae bacterium]|nr:hypothetical protein [Paracoccaceae bacterium]
MAKPRVEMVDAIGQGMRGYFSSWIVFFTGAWIFIGLYIVTYYNAPITRWLGTPTGDLAYLIDFFIVVALPIIIGLWIYIRRLNGRKRAARMAFLEEMEGRELLGFIYDPQRVLLVVEATNGADTIDVTPVWDSDGRVIGADVSTAERSAVRPFDRELFLSNF